MRAEATNDDVRPADFASAHQAGFRVVYGYFARRVVPGAQMNATKTVFRAAFADWFQDGTAEAQNLVLLRRSHLLWWELQQGANAADIVPFPGGTEQDHSWQNLSADEREVLRLAYWDRLTSQEIADVMGDSTHRVRRRLRAATSELAASLI